MVLTKIEVHEHTRETVGMFMFLKIYGSYGVHSYHVHLCILITPAELPFATFIYRLYCFSGEKLNKTAAQKKVQTILILTRCVIGKVTE